MLVLDVVAALRNHHHMPALWVDSAWLGWPLWDFIGTCAEVLALATLVIAGVGWVRARRRYPPVIFEVGVPYLLGNLAGQQRGYRVRVTNVGRSTAHVRSLYLIGATVVDEVTSPQIQWLLPSAKAFEFDVESAEIGEAWMLLICSSFENAQLMRAAWYPLQEGTELAFEHQMSYTRTRLGRGLVGAWRRWHPHAVGPKKDAVAMISMRRNKLRPIPESLLEVIYTFDDVQLRRSGTTQDGDPKKWPKLPPVPQ